MGQQQQQQPPQQLNQTSKHEEEQGISFFSCRNSSTGTATTTNRSRRRRSNKTSFCILLLTVGMLYIVTQVAFFSNSLKQMAFIPSGIGSSSALLNSTTSTANCCSRCSSINSTTTASSVANSTGDETDDYELAYRQSFGFFHDVSTEQWKIHQQIVKGYSKHMYHRFPLRQLPLKVTAWYQENYDPNFSCAFERRIGGTGNGDGPKWVCDIHRLPILAKARRQNSATTGAASSSTRFNNEIQNVTMTTRPGCVVYSVGSNGDFTFELGIQNAVGGAGVCEIHIFDPGNFGPKMPKELEATYHRWGIANETKNMTSNTVYKFEHNQGNIFLSFEDTIKALGHEGLEMIDIFKIDCEGCEWEVYEDWLKPSLPSIQQILVEVHKAPMDKVLSFFDRLMAEGYVIFHKEPNIQYDPSCIEYAFLKLHKDFFV